jgi:hypothetical protein
VNILRTIQKDEDEGWVELFFKEGQHDGDNVPGYPPGFPFPGKPKRCKEGEYLYLVYKNNVIGYGEIAKVTRHDGIGVGTEEQMVSKGGLVEMDGALKPMPFLLPCKGFQGIRYTAHDLHKLDKVAAEAEIRALKLLPKQRRG